VIDLAKYKYIIWDWNGTLLNDVDFVVDIMNKMLKKRDLTSISAEKYREIFVFPVIKYYSQLGFDFSKEPFEELALEFVNEYKNNINRFILFEEVDEVLGSIEKLGILQIILSASNEDDLIEIVGDLGISRYFVKIAGLKNHFAESKVSRAKEIIGELFLKPEEVILFGDTYHDYEVSQQIGCDCLLISKGHQSGERLSHLGVPVIESLMEVKEHLL
jgi:phosphoglycolate phosphatase